MTWNVSGSSVPRRIKRAEIMRKNHDEATARHLGIAKTLSQITKILTRNNLRHNMICEVAYNIRRLRRKPNQQALHDGHASAMITINLIALSPLKERSFLIV